MVSRTEHRICCGVSALGGFIAVAAVYALFAVPVAAGPATLADAALAMFGGGPADVGVRRRRERRGVRLGVALVVAGTFNDSD